MGYLDNSTITVDAILTKRGRELLAMGRGEGGFEITQFALADDEIDYDLWNPAHPLGSAYYGTVIENMPVTEAVPDETQSMKYKLITLPRGVAQIPYLQSDKSEVTVTNQTKDGTLDTTVTISTYFSGVTTGTPLQQNLFNGSGGYTVVLLDTTYIDMAPDTKTTELMGVIRDVNTNSNTPATSKIVALKSNTTTGPNQNTIQIKLMARAKGVTALDGLTDVTKSTKLIVTGNETGGRIVIPVTLKWVGRGTGI